MSAIIESIDFVRKILWDYGSEFKGIYVALIMTLSVFVICSLKNKGIRSYVVYNTVILVVLLLLGFCDYAFGFLTESDFGELNSIFPPIEITLLGFAIISPFLVRNVAEERKKKHMFIGLVVATSLMLVVEASVPLQLTFKSFTAPRLSNKYAAEVIEITDSIGTCSAMIPSELKISIKEYNFDANIIDNMSTDYGKTEAPTVAFTYALDTGVNYVVVKKANYLGKTNDDTLNQVAANYGYTPIKQVGDYIIYGSPNVV